MRNAGNKKEITRREKDITTEWIFGREGSDENNLLSVAQSNLEASLPRFIWIDFNRDLRLLQEFL